MAQNGQNRSKRVSKMTPFLDPLGPLFSPPVQYWPVPANSSVPHRVYWASTASTGPYWLLGPSRGPLDPGSGGPQKGSFFDPFLDHFWPKHHRLVGDLAPGPLKKGVPGPLPGPLPGVLGPLDPGVPDPPAWSRPGPDLSKGAQKAS